MGSTHYIYETDKQKEDIQEQKHDLSQRGDEKREHQRIFFIPSFMMISIDKTLGAWRYILQLSKM